MEIYYFSTELETIKLIEYTIWTIGKEPKLNKMGILNEGNVGKVIRKYVNIIGEDKMWAILEKNYKSRKKITLKQIEKEFERACV